MADKNPDDIDAVTSKIEEIKISDEISKDSGSNNPKKQSHLLRADTTSDEDGEDGGNDEYDMQGDQCGRCIIINQNFHKSVKIKNSKRLLQSRDGTKADLDRLQKMYRWLKFEVIVYEDKSKDQLETLFKKEASDKKNDSSKCLIVCILSHGKEGGIYTADGDFYKMQDILDLFDGKNCKSLLCKPKLFFIQACQGSKDGKYVQFDKPGATEDEDESYQSPKKAEKYLAANADQFVFFSSTPGNVSWRSPIEGSWFIQTVCSVFEKSAHKKNFYELVLLINNRIAKRGQKLADATVASMMSSVGQNTLRKIVRFHPDKPFKDFVSDSRIMQATS